MGVPFPFFGQANDAPLPDPKIEPQRGLLLKEQHGPLRLPKRKPNKQEKKIFSKSSGCRRAILGACRDKRVCPKDVGIIIPSRQQTSNDSSSHQSKRGLEIPVA